MHWRLLESHRERTSSQGNMFTATYTCRTGRERIDPQPNVKSAYRQVTGLMNAKTSAFTARVAQGVPLPISHGTVSIDACSKIHLNLCILVSSYHRFGCRTDDLEKVGKVCHCPVHSWAEPAHAMRVWTLISSLNEPLVRLRFPDPRGPSLGTVFTCLACAEGRAVESNSAAARGAAPGLSKEGS